MVFNKIDFNEGWVKTKTLAEFIAHEKHHGLSDAQLKEVYELIVPKTEIKKDGNNSSIITKSSDA